MIDIRQTSQYANYMNSIGWTVERVDKSYCYIKKLPLIGSFIKIQRPEILSEKEIKVIKRLSKKYRAFQIVIEPENKNQESRIRNYGFKQSRSPFVPSKTLQINLLKSEKLLLKQMHHKTRYNIKKASQNPNFKIQISNNIDGFADFWQGCARKQRVMFLSQKKEIIELYKAFGKDAHIILCYQPTSEVAERTPRTVELEKRLNLLSGILMIRTKDIAYYMYAASSNLGKKLFAPTLNVWESIKLAKKLGCKIFDFEGIYDERFPLKSWRGFTRFKKSFGGCEIEYPGCYTKYVFPFRL